jgi:hypothetical protein
MPVFNLLVAISTWTQQEPSQEPAETHTTHLISYILFKVFVCCDVDTYTSFF